MLVAANQRNMPPLNPTTSAVINSATAKRRSQIVEIIQATRYNKKPNSRNAHGYSILIPSTGEVWISRGTSELRSQPQ